MSLIDTELAELLANYPAIWDRTSPSFKDTNKKENSFKELAAKLRVSVDVVCLRYKAIREKYRKEKIKIDAATRSGAGQLSFAPWHLLTTLRFLDAVQKPRRTTTNVNAAVESSCRQVLSESMLDHDYGEVEYLLEDQNEMSENMFTSKNTEDIEEEDTPYSVPFDSQDYNTPSTSSGPSLKRSMQTPSQTIAQPLSSPTYSSSYSIYPQRAKKHKKNVPIEVMVEKLVDAAEMTAKKSIQPQTASLNQFQHFGMYVGQSLMNMGLREANLAMFEISKIIFTHNTSEYD